MYITIFYNSLKHKSLQQQEVAGALTDNSSQSHNTHTCSDCDVQQQRGGRIYPQDTEERKGDGNNFSH